MGEASRKRGEAHRFSSVGKAGAFETPKEPSRAPSSPRRARPLRPVAGSPSRAPRRRVRTRTRPFAFSDDTLAGRRRRFSSPTRRRRRRRRRPRLRPAAEFKGSSLASNHVVPRPRRRRPRGPPGTELPPRTVRGGDGGDQALRRSGELAHRSASRKDVHRRARKMQRPGARLRVVLLRVLLASSAPETRALEVRRAAVSESGAMPTGTFGRA